jgi:hypothetical protein
MDDGQSGKQDDGWNPEMNIRQNHCPYSGGFLWRVLFRHGQASDLIEDGEGHLISLIALRAHLLITD